MAVRGSGSISNSGAKSLGSAEGGQERRGAGEACEEEGEGGGGEEEVAEEAAAAGQATAGVRPRPARDDGRRADGDRHVRGGAGEKTEGEEEKNEFFQERNCRMTILLVD